MYSKSASLTPPLSPRKHRHSSVSHEGSRHYSVMNTKHSSMSASISPMNYAQVCKTSGSFCISLPHMLPLLTRTSRSQRSVSSVERFVLFLFDIHYTKGVTACFRMIEFARCFHEQSDAVKVAKDIVKQYSSSNRDRGISMSALSGRTHVRIEVPVKMMDDIKRNINENRVTEHLFDDAIAFMINMLRVDVLPRAIQQYDVTLVPEERDSTSLSTAEVEGVLRFVDLMLASAFIQCLWKIFDILAAEEGSDEQLQLTEEMYNTYMCDDMGKQLCFPPSLVDDVALGLGEGHTRFGSILRAQELLVAYVQMTLIPPFLRHYDMNLPVFEVSTILSDPTVGPLLLSFATSLHCQHPVTFCFDIEKVRADNADDDVRAWIRCVRRICELYLKPDGVRYFGSPPRIYEEMMKDLDIVKPVTPKNASVSDVSVSMEKFPDIRKKLMAHIGTLEAMALCALRVDVLPTFRAHHFYTFMQATESVDPNSLNFDVDIYGDEEDEDVVSVCSDGANGYDDTRYSVASPSGRSSYVSSMDGWASPSRRSSFASRVSSRRASVDDGNVRSSTTAAALMTPSPAKPKAPSTWRSTPKAYRRYTVSYYPRASPQSSVQTRLKISEDKGRAQSQLYNDGDIVAYTDPQWNEQSIDLMIDRIRSHTLTPQHSVRRASVARERRMNRYLHLNFDDLMTSLSKRHAAQATFVGVVEAKLRQRLGDSSRDSIVEVVDAPLNTNRGRFEQGGAMSKRDSAVALLSELKDKFPMCLDGVKRRLLNVVDNGGSSSYLGADSVTPSPPLSPPPPPPPQAKNTTKDAAEKPKRRRQVRFSRDENDILADEPPKKKGGILKPCRRESFEDMVVRVFEERLRQTDRYIAILNKGAVFKKYNSMQASDKRFFQVSPDGSELMWEKATQIGKWKKSGVKQYHGGDTVDKSGWFSTLVKQRKCRMLADVTDIRYSTYWSDRFQRYNLRNKPPWLGFTVFFPDRTVDIVCKTEEEVTTWFLGLQALVPLTSAYLTRGALLWQRARLKVEHQATETGMSEGRLWRDLILDARKKVRMEKFKRNRMQVRSWRDVKEKKLKLQFGNENGSAQPVVTDDSTTN